MLPRPVLLREGGSNAEGRGWQEVVVRLDWGSGEDASLQRQGDKTAAAQQGDGQTETCWAQMTAELVSGSQKWLEG